MNDGSESEPAAVPELLAAIDGLEERFRTVEPEISSFLPEEGRFEFMIPTSAVLGRAFVLAKINFLKAVEHLLKESGDDAASACHLVSDMVGDAVFSKLAEELLSAVLSNPTNAIDLKRAAAQRLLTMWNNRLKMPVGEFPTVLLSAWRARRKVRAI